MCVLRPGARSRHGCGGPALSAEHLGISLDADHSHGWYVAGEPGGFAPTQPWLSNVLAETLIWAWLAGSHTRCRPRGAPGRAHPRPRCTHACSLGSHRDRPCSLPARTAASGWGVILYLGQPRRQTEKTAKGPKRATQPAVLPHQRLSPRAACLRVCSLPAEGQCSRPHSPHRRPMSRDASIRECGPA